MTLTAVLAVVVVLSLAVPGWAQQSSACGDPGILFDVKTASTQPAAAQPEPGKALLYLIQDDVKYEGIRPTVRFGVNGHWVGATHANSYFSISVSPGVQHLCVDWQSYPIGTRRDMAAAHFTAEAGGVYYFAARDYGNRQASASVSLIPLDSDQGELELPILKFATSKPKK